MTCVITLKTTSLKLPLNNVKELSWFAEHHCFNEILNLLEQIINYQ